MAPAVRLGVWGAAAPPPMPDVMGAIASILPPAAQTGGRLHKAPQAPTVTAPPPCDEHPPPRRLPDSPSRLQRRTHAAQPRAAPDGGKRQADSARHGKRKRITIPPALRARRKRTAQPPRHVEAAAGARKTGRGADEHARRQTAAHVAGHSGHPKRRTPSSRADSRADT